MMFNLMAIFEPSSMFYVLGINFNWGLMIWIFLTVSSTSASNWSTFNFLKVWTCFVLVNLQTTLVNKSFMKPNQISVFIFSNLFIFLLSVNFFGLFPYNYTFSGQIWFVASAAFLFWVSLFGFKLLFVHKIFMSHMVPYGCPLNLSSSLSIIELMGFVARPFTLTIRLVGNMSAGHLILSVCTLGVSECSSFLGSVKTLIFEISVNGLEILVAFIQAFVFCLLISVYSMEV